MLTTNLLPGLVDCKACPLFDNGFVVPGRGPTDAEIMFIGEAPGRNESNSGLAFIGDAGQYLTKLIEIAGLDPASVYITNTVKHWPGYGNPNPKIAYVRACAHWLDQEIEQVNPNMVVTLGAVALARIAPDLSLKLHHGQKFIRNVNGQERILVPMYHPAAVLHVRSMQPVIEADFARLMQPPLIPPPVIPVLVERPLPPIPDGAVLALDLETTGLDSETDTVVCANWSWDGKTGYVCYDIDAVVEMLCAFTGIIVFHNAQFDLAFLAKLGVVVGIERVRDTMLSGYVLGKEKLSLKGRAMNELGYEMTTFEALAGEKPKDASLIPVEEMVPYAAADGAVTWKLHERDRIEIEEIGAGELLDVQHKLIPILDAMRQRGVLVDKVWLKRLQEASVVEKRDAMIKVWEQVGHDFNIDSPPKLGQVLFDELGLKPLKRTKGRTAWSTDSEVLKYLEDQHPIIPAVMDYREIAKMSGTYINPVEEHLWADGRIHPTWLQIGTGSGRLSCENPNAQNQPSRSQRWKKLVRGLFVAGRDHTLLSVDYSQIELRVAAALSGDPVMRDIYESGGNIHLHTLHTILRLPDATDKTHPAQYKLAKCLDGSTLVRTDTGLVQIEDILEGLALDEHQEIPTVSLYDGRSSFITATSGLKRHDRPSSLVVTNEAIVCTTNDHRILTTDDGLVEASKLTTGQELPKVTSITQCGEPQTISINPVKGGVGGCANLILDERWAYFAGVFQGDGSCNSHAVTITHGSSDSYEQWRRVVFSMAEDIGFTPRLTPRKTDTILGSRTTTRFLSQLGLADVKEGYGGVLSARKRLRVPWWILRGGAKVGWSYLAGLVDTDGTIASQVSITTKDPLFAGQLAVLMQALGIQVHIGTSYNKQYERYYYRICMRRQSLLLVQEQLCLRSEKLLKLLAMRHQRATRSHPHKVVMVIPFGNRTVYDFHVNNDDHIYQQGGLLGHNNINFGMIYRLGDAGLQRYLWNQAGIKVSLAEAHEIRTQFLNEFKVLMAWEDDIVGQVLKYGWVSTKMGLRRYFRYIDAKNPEESLKAAVNHPVQGTAGGDIMRSAMVQMGHLPLIINAHDELIFEVKKSELEVTKDEVCGIMIKTAEDLLDFPVEVDWEENERWGEMTG